VISDATVAAEVSLPGHPAHRAAVVARLPDAALADRLRIVLGALAVPAAPAGAAPVDARRTPQGWSLRSSHLGPQACATDDDLLTLLEWTVIEELLAGLPDTVRLHAAGVRVGDVAVLAVGPSGAGKSAVAHAWSRGGLPLYGDDVVLLAPDGAVHAFPRMGKLDTALARAHGESLEQTPEWNPSTDEIWMDPARGGGWAKPAPVGVMAALTWREGAPTDLRAIAPTALLRLMVSQVFGVSAADAFRALAPVLRRAQTFAVTFGDARDAAAALAERARAR
jgi:hypothetical protein